MAFSDVLFGILLRFRTRPVRLQVFRRVECCAHALGFVPFLGGGGGEIQTGVWPHVHPPAPCNVVAAAASRQSHCTSITSLFPSHTPTHTNTHASANSHTLGCLHALLALHACVQICKHACVHACADTRSGAHKHTSPSGAETYFSIIKAHLRRDHILIARVSCFRGNKHMQYS